MTRSIEETRVLFDTWARTYDRDMEDATGILEGYDASIRAAVSLCPVGPGAKILDIGIGTGNFARQFEARGATICGVDLSAAMVEACQKLHPAYHLATGTFQSIPFAAEEFDGVISSFCFHEVALRERRAACEEVYRVTRAGGHVCLLDIMFASPAAMEEAKRHLQAHWDSSEDYPVIGDLSEDLYACGFHSLQWVQTGRLHWMCLAYK